jgi:hypothetical protein
MPVLRNVFQRHSLKGVCLLAALLDTLPSAAPPRRAYMQSEGMSKFEVS